MHQTSCFIITYILIFCKILFNVIRHDSMIIDSKKEQKFFDEMCLFIDPRKIR